MEKTASKKNNKNHITKILGNFLIMAQFLMSCSSYKNTVYLQEDLSQEVTQSKNVKTFILQPQDRLSITVSYPESPDLAIPFNLTTTSTSATGEGAIAMQPTRLSYLIKSDGTIDFPVLGSIKARGLIPEELEDKIEELLSPYFKKRPIVNVQVLNFKVSVLGEVNRPGTFNITEERITILEAIALAGDLTIHGKRSNVMLVREDYNGEKTSFNINLNDRSLLTSQQYYLQQNDVIYVLPNKAKAHTANITSNTSIWITVTGSLLTLASLLVTLIK